MTMLKKAGKFVLRFAKGAISEIPGVNILKTNQDSDDNGRGKTSKDRLAGQIAAVIVAVLSLLETFGLIDLM